MGGHTHDGMPVASMISNKSGKTLVTNAGSNGKFLGVLDFRGQGRPRSADFRYKLLPVFANMLAADSRHGCTDHPHPCALREQLTEKLASQPGPAVPAWQLQRHRRPAAARCTDGCAECRDRLLPGLPLGHQPAGRPGDHARVADGHDRHHLSVHHGDADVRQHHQDHSGRCGDNLFNPDPYYQQGGDMVRVGGLQYSCDPQAVMGKRIDNMRLNGKPVEADRTYKVAGWAPVSEEAKTTGGKPIWDPGVL
jgi:sulfur-oxidizing protein SoxB